MRTIVLSLLLVAAPAFAQEKAAPATTTETKTDTKTTTTSTSKPKHGDLMDVNTATADQLKTLPGVTDDIAKKIIAGRPYTGKDQLLKQSIVDKDGYAKIRPLIVAKQPKAMGGQGAVEAHTGPGGTTEKGKDNMAKPAADAPSTAKPSDPTKSPAATKTPDATKK